VGPNSLHRYIFSRGVRFQSSVRINVGPNALLKLEKIRYGQFQSSVRINVGPNGDAFRLAPASVAVSILRED